MFFILGQKTELVNAEKILEKPNKNVKASTKKEDQEPAKVDSVDGNLANNNKLEIEYGDEENDLCAKKT